MKFSSRLGGLKESWKYSQICRSGLERSSDGRRGSKADGRQWPPCLRGCSADRPGGNPNSLHYSTLILDCRGGVCGFFPRGIPLMMSTNHYGNALERRPSEPLLLHTCATLFELSKATFLPQPKPPCRHPLHIRIRFRGTFG